jgi:hypothetical protein
MWFQILFLILVALIVWYYVRDIKEVITDRAINPLVVTLRHHQLILDGHVKSPGPVYVIRGY